ncbi:MAG TPA: tetratricopeptide repeat protein, partial [Candidatus Methanoperedens sp.]|nr:tetratricopeptide repeat protein [Candidatus Methanoperedens sp.]
LGAYVWHLRRRSAPRYLAVTLLLIFGLAAKPILLTLPLIMLALDFWPLGRGFSRIGGETASPRCVAPAAVWGLLVEKGPWLVLCGTAGAVAFLAQRAGGGTPGPGEWNLAARFTKPVWACAAYLGLSLWPAGLIPFYPFQARPLFSPAVLGAGALLAAVTATCAGAARRRPWLAAGWAWYLAALAPASGIVPFGAHDIADRFTYLPMIGPVFALAAEARTFSSRSPRRTAAVLAAASVILAALGLATRNQIGFWRDSSRLFARMLEISPGNEVAVFGLAAESARRGELATAEHYLEGAARGRLYRYDALTSLGRILAQTGRKRDAVRRFSEALELRPDDHMLRMRVSTLLLELERPDEAVRHLEIMARALPDTAEVHNNLAVALAGTGRLAEAEEHLRRALALDPGYAAARANLAAVLSALVPPVPR